MTSVPIQSLVQSLSDEFAQPEPNRGKIAQLLRDYAASHQDWRTYALVSPRCYTRNLVELNDRYELLVLCWDTNQCSPIHNHEAQDCWMAVLEGPIEEVHYEAPTAEGPLSRGPVRRFETGQAAYITDETSTPSPTTSATATAKRRARSRASSWSTTRWAESSAGRASAPNRQGTRIGRRVAPEAAGRACTQLEARLNFPAR